MPTVREQIQSIKDRLALLVEERPFAFTKTPRHLAEHHLLGLSRFEGASKQEIEALERLFRGELSLELHEYLRALGSSAGPLFKGSELADSVAKGRRRRSV